MPIKHSKVSTIQTTGDASLVGPSDWNADHAISGALDLTGASSILVGPGGITGVSPTQFAGAPSGVCLANQTAVNTLTGDFYDCIAGAWLKVGPGGNPGVLVSPVITPNPLNLDVNLGFKGPNPYVDVTRYGVRALVPTSTPVFTGVTATISSGSAVATVSTASCPGQAGSVCFQNGDGVVVYGAGAPHSMSTPVGVTVTPSVAQAGTGTGLVVNGPVGGATTYNYRVLARNKAGGLTAASTVATTTTGGASLGRQSVNILAHARTGNITTVTTSVAHGLSVGAMVYIAQTSDDTNFGGWYPIATVPDTAHFTFQSGLDATNGAPASATGGVAVWFNANRITWTQVTGAWEYCIYGRTGGSLTWIGCSRPQGPPGAYSNPTDMTFDDFGSPMMDGFTRPALIPNTPPVSATSNSLVTTISSGASTTTLTLSATASTTVTGATIRFDNAPNILTAANVARNNNGLLHFPVSTNGQSYPVNSYLLLPSQLTVSFAMGLYLNDTVEVGQGSYWSGTVLPQGQPPPSFGQNGWVNIGANEANPGVYSPPGLITYWKSLSFFGQGLSNGGLPFFAEQNTPITFEDVSFTSSTSGTDYMGVGLILRGDAPGVNNSSYVNLFRNVLFSGGPAQSDAATATPFFYCNGCGLTSLTNINMSVRGIFFRPVGAGGAFELSTGRQQGPIMPTVMYFNNSGNSTLTSSVVRQFEQDTGTHAIFANMSGSSTMLHIEGAGYPGTFVGASGPLVTGNPIISIDFQNEQMNGVTGQNTQTHSFPTGTALDGAFRTSTSGPYASQEFNSGVSVGKMYSIFAKGLPPAAPTAVVSAGGSVSIGTHTYQVVPVWANGGEGAVSPVSNSVTTSSGNQTVTVTWTAVAGSPKGYDVYQDGQLVSLGAGNCSTIPQYTGTSAVITNFVCGSNTTVQAGGPTILNSNGLFAPKLQIGTAATTQSGAGAPAAGLCTTSTGGSLYLRTDGTTTTSFYVCDGATGTWTAK